MTTTFNVNEIIQRAIQQEIKILCDEEAEKAAQRIKERLPEVAARVALNVNQYINIRTNEKNMVITIGEQKS